MNDNYKRLIQLSLDLGHEHFNKMVAYQRVGNFHKAEWHRAQMLKHVEQAREYGKRTEDNGEHNSE